MKKIALAAALSMSATGSFAGGMVEPTMVPAVVVAPAAASSSNGGLLIPLLLLLVLAAAAANA